MPKINNNCDVCGFVHNVKNPILIKKHWVVILANDQAYLGRCYVTLKRHCGDLAKLTKDEWEELFDVIYRLENSVKLTFGATLFNWTCLMNLAFNNNPPNPHIHWHFRPRYNHPVKVGSLVFEDPEFGQHYAREKERSMVVSEKVQVEIVKKIKYSLLSALPPKA